MIQAQWNYVIQVMYHSLLTHRNQMTLFIPNFLKISHFFAKGATGESLGSMAML
jgi:hypothetical protein